MADVNLVAVLIAAVVSFFIGMLWYSLLLFSKAWMKSMGITEKDMKKKKPGNMVKVLGPMFVSTLIMAYVLEMLIGSLGITTAIAGMQIAFWIWLGFMATINFGAVLFESRSKEWFFITAGYQLVYMLVMGPILAVL